MMFDHCEVATTLFNERKSIVSYSRGKKKYGIEKPCKMVKNAPVLSNRCIVSFR